MLPAPAFSFTIPSVHDDVPLDCRVYHPTKFSPSGVASHEIWQKKGAIVAHPYGPLGGCYDDPVVRVVATEMLKSGFVVGTFNFRCGALLHLFESIPTDTYPAALARRRAGLAGLPSLNWPTTPPLSDSSSIISAVFSHPVPPVRMSIRRHSQTVPCCLHSQPFLHLPISQKRLARE